MMDPTVRQALDDWVGVIERNADRLVEMADEVDAGDDEVSAIVRRLVRVSYKLERLRRRRVTWVEADRG